MKKVLRSLLRCMPFLAVIFTNPAVAYHEAEALMYGLMIALLAFLPFGVAFNLFVNKLRKDPVPKKTWEKHSSKIFIVMVIIASISVLIAVQEARIRFYNTLFYLLMGMFFVRGLELRFKAGSHFKSYLAFSFFFNIAAVYYSHFLVIPNVNLILVGIIAFAFAFSLLFAELAIYVVKFYPDNRLIDTKDCPGYLPLVRFFLCSAVLAPASIGLLVVFNILPAVYNACFLSLLFWLPLSHYLQPSLLCIALPEKLELKALVVSFVFFLMLGAGTWYVLAQSNGVLNVA